VLAREVSRLADSVPPDEAACGAGDKWPLLTLTRLREAQARLGLAEGGPEGGAALLARVASAYRRLAAIDPLRRGYYEDAAAGRARVVAQALGTV